ncbi:MAG: hypothetical protein ACRD3K_03400, partial [Edaphobacter sp.]
MMESELLVDARSLSPTVTHMSLRQHANLKNFFPLISRRTVLTLVLLASAPMFFTNSGRAQTPLSPGSTQDTPQPSTNGSAAAVAFGGSSDAADLPASTAMLSNLNAPGTPLPADQIIQILQQNPDLLTEVKTQVADHLQQQGTQVQPSDISDDMLYNQISTNSNIRANITT